MMYRNTATGETFTREEIEELFEQFGWEMQRHFDSFDEYLDHMLQTGELEEVE